ncbi:MAG: DUF4199 domain-containing protein [Bacteroidota bacterium]
MGTKNYLISPALKAGFIIGSVGISLFMIQYIGGIKPVGIMKPILLMLLGFSVSIILLVVYIKKHRNDNNGFITFGDAFLFGFIALLVSAFISSLFNYLFNQIFDPEYTRSIIEAQKDYMENYLSGKISEEQIQESLDKIDEGMNKSVLKQSINSLIGGSVFALIVSLIVGAIMKRKQSLFDNQVQEGVD